MIDNDNPLKTFIIDVDETLAMRHETGDYSKCIPNVKVIDKTNALYDYGHIIVLFTARGMRTFNENVNEIRNAHYTTMVTWLEEHGVKYHRLIFGKPWGPNVYYVDDRMLSIKQFVESDESEFEKNIAQNAL